MLSVAPTQEWAGNIILERSGCWGHAKTGFIKGGYRNNVRAEGRYKNAHRAVYEWLVGPIPDGLQIDHLCRNPGCINPSHMEPVTPRENVMRGDTIAAENAAKTHCKHGHEFTAENTYVWPKKPNSRSCRRCHADQEALRQRRLRREKKCSA